ncbi:Dienelactone hydrolase family [plant metagenome]|uniref:Dienelactone hydrolase family n=1 Tax=plant metagenome TaxID=1297885 RepID=A0A484R9X2_9ZZZZ
MTTVTLTSKEGKPFNAYYAKGPSSSARGIVLIQEIFGINAAMRELADTWAAKGYNVVVPDLFWRQAPDVELDPTVKAEFERGYGMMQAMKTEETLADLEAARAWLAQESGHEKIALVGYCMGGMLAVRAAFEIPVKCAVSYYGVALDSLLNDAPIDTAPTLLHIAGEDRFQTHDVRDLVMDLATAHPQFTPFIYDGVDHAFARPKGEHFDADAAAKAEQRSQTFLAEHLV